MTMKIEQNKRRAGFPMQKNLDDFDDDFHTSISKREVNSLLDFGFIDNRENVVFIGSPGVGKTHLAIGLGLKAIEAGYKVCFSMALTLIEALEQAELKGELKRNSPTGESSFLTVMSRFLSLTELSIIHTFLCWEGDSYRLKSKLNK
jgi:DNA replication protein DnaC